MSGVKETITAMEEDDEDSNCLLIDENYIPCLRDEDSDCLSRAAEQPVNANNCQLNATASIANNEETIRINADTSPKKQNNSISAGLSCKDFCRIPFDNDSNLLTPDMVSSDLYARLVDNTNSRVSAADPVQFRNKGTSNDFRPAANNFTDNVRRATDTLIQIPNPTETYYRVPQLPPNTIYGNSDPKTGSVNTNRLDAIGNASTSIPLNRNGYRIQSENMTIISILAENMIPAAQNLSHPGGPSTANGAEVLSNVDRLNGLIINNCLHPAMNMDSYRPVSIHPRHSQKLYASDANRRQMYSHDRAARSANYGPNIGRCQCAFYTGACGLINCVTPTMSLPTNYIPNRRYTCLESCNVHRSGPLYPAPPNIQAQPNFTTTAPRNPGQALNGNGAISRGGVHRVEDPITYANYQQVYLAEMRRNSNAAGQSTLSTTREHTVNNIPGPPMNQKAKAMAATNAAKSCANTNHINSGVINVAGFPAISASYPEATRCGNSSNTNLITNSEAFGIKNTVKNKRPTKTIKKHLKDKTKVVTKNPRGRPPKSKNNHLQLINMNIATTLAHKQNVNLQQPTVEMRIPAEQGEIKLAYNTSDANIMQAPLSYELHLQNNMHNDIYQPQVKPSMQTIEQIMMQAADIAMRNNVQQAENVTMYPKVQTSMSTVSYKRDTLIRHVDSSVVNLNKSGASTSGTLTSGPVVSASAKGFKLIASPNGFELRPPASLSGVKDIRDKIESIDLASDSGMLHDKISMTFNKVQTPNTEQAGMTVNSENAELPVIMEACPQQAEMSLNTNKAQIDINLLSKTQQANMNMTSNRVQTINRRVYNTQQDNMYTNVEPALASYMNNCETLTSLPQSSRAVIQASNAYELEMLTSTAAKDITMNKDTAELESRANISNADTGTPLDITTVKKDSGLYIDKTELESRPNMTIQTNIQQTMDLHTETLQTLKSMETCTQQTSNNTYIKNVLAPLTCVTHYTLLTSTTSNTCNPTYTTSSIESVTHNIENADMASSFNNWNPKTGLMSSVPRLDTINYTMPTQTIVQHHETDQTVDHISIDLLKSILDNVHRNATLQNTNLANTNRSVHEPNTNLACNNNSNTYTITDQLPAVQEIKDHNEIYEGTETIKYEYATGTVSEGNIISHKSKSDEESNKLKIARQHLALLNIKNNDFLSDPVEDNSQKSILDEYGPIISSVLKRVNISQTSNKVSFSKQEISVDSCITSPDIVRSSVDIKSLETRKRKIQSDREINYNSDSGSRKRYRRASDTNQNNNYTCFSRSIQKSAPKFHQTDVAKHKVKKNKTKKESSSTSNDEILFFKFQIEFFRHEQERLMAKNFRKSADELNYEIHKLIYISENEDAKADMKFECPECHYVSIYSPRLLYCKEYVHNLEKLQKIVHCQSCIQLRKKYKNSFVRFVKKNLNKIKERIAGNSNTAKTNDDTINSNDELKTHAIEEQINIIKNCAITDSDTINSNNELKTRSAYIRTHSNSTHSADIKLPVKLSCEMLKPSFVKSLIKLKRDTTIELIKQIVSTKPVTVPSMPQNKNVKTAIKINDGNTENKTERPVTFENADNNRNIDRSRKVSELNDAETTTNINAKLPERNTNNSTDNVKNNAESTCRVTQLINKEINTARKINDDNNKIKISSKVRKSPSNETATLCQRKINTGTNNNNKNNNKNCERKNFRDDTANRPDVEPKPNSIRDVINKSSISDLTISLSRKGTSLKLIKTSGEHDKCESRRTNDKDEENNKRGDDRKSSSDNDDNGNAAKAIDNSYKTLKNNCKSNEKSELPEVHISGEEGKSLNRPNKSVQYRSHI